MLIRHQLNDGWKFRGMGESEWLPAQVPGCVHTDLRRNGKIEDPFYGTNEHRLQWIDKQDWEYETIFYADERLMASSHIELVFDGLDTYADVYLNGSLLLSVNNMFRQWRGGVRDKLQVGDNRLRILFRSPIKEDLPKLEQLGYSLPATNDQSELGELGDRKVSIFARKAPYHYGWDWGPRFVTSGIWRDVRLEAWSDYRLQDLYIRQDSITAARAKLTAIAEVEAERETEGRFAVSTDRGQLWSKPVKLQGGLNRVELELVIDEPELWWCRGMGAPNLYTFTALFQSADGYEDSLNVVTGLRSIRLVRKPDEHGVSFYFELNGVAVFAKGVNHIPNDSFVTEVTRERYRHEIESAARANMNMLRIWGGGIYEQAHFYELCDQYGMMVWQDFMFACSMYPGDEAFLDNVRHEAAYNVKRLRNYACIALWCGNNEIDTAWSHYDEQAGWGGWKSEFEPGLRNKIWADYEQIFHRILPDAVDQHSDGIDYWPSSPMQELTGDKTQHAHSRTNRGDIHYWGVWHSVEPFENYNIHVGRFMSEYGFQSFPEHRSVRTYAEEADMELESDVMLAHQKNGAGNRLIKQYMEIYMKEPKDFTSFLYMSQVLQAEAMKTAFEAHRRRKGFCMGSLYWQMNDCWPVASWAGMDYYGRWKATHYYTKRSFSDVLVSFEKEQDGTIGIHVVSDRLEAIRGTLEIELRSFQGERLHKEQHAAALEANAAARIAALSEAALLRGQTGEDVVLLATLLDEDGRLIDSGLYYFVPSRDMKLAAPHISMTEEQGPEGVVYRLEADRLAKDVWLSTDKEGIFSDNFFDLVPGRPVAVQFLARSAEDGAAFVPAHPESVEVRSMTDFLK